MSACCLFVFLYFLLSTFEEIKLYTYSAAWVWKRKAGYKMINKVASSFQVGDRRSCMSNCNVSPICDSYNYRPSDKTCQLNTHDTQHTLDSCVHAGSGLILPTRHASSTHTTLHSSPTRLTLSPTAPGIGPVPPSLKSSKLSVFTVVDRLNDARSRK